MGDKLKTLMEKAQPATGEAEKIAEELIAQGQLLGAGMNYELFEKEGAPMGAFLTKLQKAVAEFGGRAAGKATAGATKADILAQRLGGKTIAAGRGAVRKLPGQQRKIPGSELFIPPGGKAKEVALPASTLAKRIAGYGLPAIGVAGTAAAVPKGKKKVAAEEPVRVADLIMRYSTEEGK